MRAHLGFGRPRSSCPSARGRRAAGAAARAAAVARGDLLHGPHERASHAYGKVVPRPRARLPRALRPRPDVVAFPRDEADVELVARLVRGAGRRDPLRRRHQRRRRGRGGVGDRYAGAVTIDLRGLDRVLEVDLRLARRADPGRRDRAWPRGPAAPARPHAAALPAVVRASRRSAAGSRRAPAATSRRSTRTSTTWSSRSARSRRRRDREPAAARVGRGAEPRPAAARLRGHPRRDHRGVGALQERPRFKASAASRSRTSRGRRGGARARAERAAPGELPAARPARGRLTGAGDGRRALVLGFESADHPVDPWMDRALELRRRPRRRPSPAARRRRRGRRLGEAGAGGVPARAVPARHVRRVRA